MNDALQPSRLSLAGAIGALTSAAGYVLATMYEQLVAGPTDPFLIVRDIHFGYYHRAALAAWIGGVGALVAFRLIDQPSRVAAAERWITRGTLPLVVVLGVLSMVFP